MNVKAVKNIIFSVTTITYIYLYICNNSYNILNSNNLHITDSVFLSVIICNV